MLATITNDNFISCAAILFLIMAVKFVVAHHPDTELRVISIFAH
jgi:hypothetical protein